MNTTLAFMKDLRKFPALVQGWLMLLGCSNMLFPMIYIDHWEAQIMLGSTLLSFAFGVLLFRRQGMTRLLGVMHLPWVFALYLLVTSGHFLRLEDVFGIWTTIASLLTGTCLILDFRDITKYFRGDKKPIV